MKIHINNWDEIMRKAMIENEKTDVIALETLGFKSVEEFIESKLTSSTM